MLPISTRLTSLVAAAALTLTTAACHTEPSPIPVEEPPAPSASVPDALSETPGGGGEALLSDALASLARAFRGGTGELACVPWVDASARVVVSGTRSALPETLSRPELRAFPDAESSVLFALSEANTPALSETLWRADCTSGSVARVHTRSGADFYHAAGLGDALVIGLDGALARFEPNTSDTTLLGLPTTLCDAPRDRVLTLNADGDTLHIARECALDEGRIAAHELHLDLTTGQLHQPRPILALELTETGALLLSEGGRCDTPGIIDAGEDGVLWVSRDQGRTFARSLVEGAKTPIASVRAASRAGSHLIARSAVCDRQGERVGGELFISANEGLRWTALRLPESVNATQVVAASLNARGDTVTLWSGEAWQRRMWTSADGGATWSRAARAESEPLDPHTVRGSGGVVYQKSGDGLWRYVGAASQRVFPPREGA